MITVTPAGATDRDAARELLWRLRVVQPQITQVWADSAYVGQLTNWSGDFLNMTLKTVSRPRGAHGFAVLPRRWKVERTLGWLMKSRRSVRGYERLAQHSEAHLTWALHYPDDPQAHPEGASGQVVEEAVTTALQRPCQFSARLVHGSSQAQLAKVPWWKYIRQPVSVSRHKELRNARRPWLSAKYVT